VTKENASGGTAESPPSEAPIISTLNEKPLHATLKEWYAAPGDLIEAKVDGYVIDLVRDDMLIEIQTRNFSALKTKLAKLVQRHKVRLVYPIAREKWIVKVDQDGLTQLNRRKSPKRGRQVHAFDELVSFPNLMTEPNFSLEVLITQEEEVRRHDAKRAWRRRGWVTVERRLIQVVDRHLFETPRDLAQLLPIDLPEPFTTSDLAKSLSQPRRLAQKMTYCLRGMGAIEVEGKKGNSYLYRPSIGYYPFETGQ
jgi:hypothetical protein